LIDFFALLINFFAPLQHYFSKCLEMEEKLSCARALTDDFDALSKRIKEQANLMIDSEFESHVAAAGFMVPLLHTN
jgi:hypothetical protein